MASVTFPGLFLIRSASPHPTQPLLLLLLLSRFSHVRLLATPWTAAYKAPPSMGFSRQEYWSGVQLPSPHPTPLKDKFMSPGEATLSFKEMY